MSVEQISVFVESKPGHLYRVLDSFTQHNVSVRGYSASDTGDYGIVRFVVNDPKRAMQVLSEMGFAAKESEVLCIRLVDKPGELARVVKVLSDSHINVNYSYSLISTYICMSVDDVPAAERELSSKPIVLLTQKDLE